MSTSNKKQPILVISHGAPLSIITESSVRHCWEDIGKKFSNESVVKESTDSLLKAMPQYQKPKVILVISAHWEESNVTVQTSKKHTTMYDFYGFPEELYKIKYEAPGNPEYANKVIETLQSHGIKTETEETRGIDHGVWVPLKLMFPNADIPIVQISLLNSLNPERHIALGEALAELRDENVLIMCSGQATHNLRAINFGAGFDSKKNDADTWAREFENWLDNVYLKKVWSRTKTIHAKFCCGM